MANSNGGHFLSGTADICVCGKSLWLYNSDEKSWSCLSLGNLIHLTFDLPHSDYISFRSDIVILISSFGHILEFYRFVSRVSDVHTATMANASD